MRILVTGSRGILGTALTHSLEASGHRVVSFGLPAPPLAKVAPLPAEDVRNPEAVIRAARGVDGVIHLAAISRAEPAESDPMLAESVNAGGTQIVLEALNEASPHAWFILASSREVYGEPDYLPVDENHRLNPKGVYGRTKVEGEQTVRKHAETEGRRAVILRYTNVYGSPTDYPERVIPSFVTAALRGEPLEVRGPDKLLDFLHIDDAVGAVREAIRCLEESKGSGFDVFNIASGQGITVGNLAKKVIEATRSHSPVRVGSSMDWETSSYVGNVAKAERVLSWKPTVEFDRGLKELARETLRLRAR